MTETKNRQCLWCGGKGYITPNGFHPTCLEEFLEFMTPKLPWFMKIPLRPGRSTTIRRYRNR